MVAAPNLMAVGKTGLAQRSGRVYEEWHPKLSGRQWFTVAREMRDNNATIAASMHAIVSLIKGVDWHAEPASEDARAQEEAEFLEQVFDDLDQPFKKTAGAAVDDGLTFGACPHEIIHKRRLGPRKQDPALHSRYDDGRLGLKEIAYRAIESTDSWHFGDDDQWEAWTQRPPSDFSLRTIPRAKMWHFQPDDHKGNPEGRPPLRHCYRSWFKQKGMEDIEAVVVQRFAAGIPLARMPIDHFGDDAPSDKAEVRDDVLEQLKYLAVNRMSALAYPGKVNSDGEQTGWDIEFLTTGGSRPIDIGPIIDRYRKDSATVFLTQFIYLGMDKVGSYSLSSDMTNLFAVSLGALLDELEESIDQQVIQPLYEMNGVPHEHRATWKHGDLEKEDLKQLADTLLQLVTGGLVTPDSTLEEYVRRTAGLPEQEDEMEPVGGDVDLPDSQPSEVAAVPGANAVQDTGLNGAQVTAVLDTLVRVMSEGLPKKSARAVILASFPAVSTQLVEDMLEDIVPREVPSAPPGQEAPAPQGA